MVSNLILVSNEADLRGDSNDSSTMCISCKLTKLLPHPAGGEAASRVGPKIVLDHVRVYIIYINYVCALWISSLLVVYDAIDNASSSRAHED